VSQTARQLVDAALERAETWEPRTNAFSREFAEDARAEADALDAAGSRTAPLSGMPVAVKELFDVRGHPTTGCSAAIAAEPTERDATLVERLRAAGTIVIGKTNMHELAAGVTNLESSCGPTRNPWDPTRMSGGSSGGSAAAVASGIVPLSLVSDTGGSARIPAAFCGVWSLKATHGELPLDGMMPLAPEMDCAGLISDSLDVLEAGWQAIAGPVAGPSEPSSIGVLRRGRWERCSVDVRRAIDAAVARLPTRDIEVRDVDGSELDDAHLVWNRIAWPSFADRYARLADHPALGSETVELIRWGHDHRDERPDALARAERIRTWFTNVFESVDLLLTATTPYVAPRLDAAEVDLGDGSTMDVHRGGPAWFTTAANVAGLPAMSVPFAWTDANLPIGVQLIGKPNEESTLLRGGAILDRIRPAERPPLPER
jgi:aspartyl-tRNA(Asn)/glutamyl-tRNA(Gln) amidotransferase subunit A